MSTPGHLARRLLFSLVPTKVTEAEYALVRDVLRTEEYRLWQSMQAMDRRHSLMVLDRRRLISPEPDRDDSAAALLHDVGKTASRLGPWSRVLATIIGPRWWRFALYHRHEQIGIEVLRARSNTVVLALLEGSLGARSEALRLADEV